MVGEMPLGWSLTTLGDCSDWYSGGTPNTEISAYWGGTIPWITASSLHDFYVTDSERRVTELGIQNGTRLMPRNTILFVVRGMSLKSEFRVGISCLPVAFGQDCKAIIAHRDVEPLFLANVLRAKAPEIMGLVDEASHGTGRLQTEALKGLEILLPPLPEQRAIAHILGSLDDKIELNRRMNATLEELARALFQAWFVDFAPMRAKLAGQATGLPQQIADLFPAALVASEVGEIPDGWAVKPIGELAEVVGGSTPSTANPAFWDNGAHHWATPKDLSALQTPALLDTERRITDLGLKQISSGLLPVGTVLLSSRAPIGYLAIAEAPVAINQGFIAMKPRAHVSNLFLLLWARFAHDQIVSRANGSTFLEISKGAFRPIPVVTPPSTVMSNFDRVVRPLYAQIVANERESRTLAALRDALLPRLISGEVRVSEAEGPISTKAQ